MIDYNFCRQADLTLNDLLIWLDLDNYLDNDGQRSYDFFGRQMMVVGEAIRISCVHKDFDRWANSEEYWFDISHHPDKLDFIDWVIEQRGEE